MSDVLKIHQSHHDLCDFDSIFKYLANELQSDKDAAHLHVYPELFLSGYALQDICLQNSFIDSYEQHLSDINEFSMQLNEGKSLHLIGGLHYELSESGIPQKIENCMYKLTPGKPLEKIYAKMLLPNYDIFDERKYYTPGRSSEFIEWNGLKLALLVCEDMWPSVHYKRNPLVELKKFDESYDLVINLSASPYDIDKDQKRLDQGSRISHYLGAPFVYVNLVAEEDEILFDGGSFVINGDTPLLQLPHFKSQAKSIPLKELTKKRYKNQELKASHSWENLFYPNIINDNKSGKNVSLRPLSEDQCQSIVNALTFGVQEYANKNGFKKFIVALSGGIDSALTLALVKRSLSKGRELEAIYMPSQYSKAESLELSEKLCNNLDIPLKNIPIKFLHSMMRNTFHMNYPEEFSGLTDENVQARLRAIILMARSNQSNALVVNTSNKSEIAMGYSTLYGDSVGAISLIGDLYKTEVYTIANYINQEHGGELIPEEIIDRKPSAELREDQYDSDTLPPYPILDTILECFLSYRFSREDLIAMGLPEEHIDYAFKLYSRSEYKRRQFCPILKVKTKSFGFGYRIPINKNNNFYLQN